MRCLRSGTKKKIIDWVFKEIMHGLEVSKEFTLVYV